MDHLLSMEKEFIEKNNLRKLGLKNKKLPKKSHNERKEFLLLGFERLFLSKILFFEN